MSETLGPGATFAGCRIEAVAGRGGMGVVYRATQLTLGRVVALKAIAPGFGDDAAYRERFKRESQLAAMIDHPNIIPVYEAGESEDTLYLIMRWAEGTDLRQTISSGPLPPARAVRLLRPVASALAAAHKQGLVHRDVKPANVLIARGDDEHDEHVYLTDFGIARRSASQSSLTKTGALVGTVAYMAPECLIGGRGDAVSDVYSFGCMLFEALTGQQPYQRPNEAAAAFAHVHDPTPSARAIAPDVPEPLDAVIARAMAKHPRERFGSAGELVRALDEAMGEPAAEAAPAPPAVTTASENPVEVALPATATTLEEPAAPPRRSSRRWRRAGLALAGLVVLGGIAAGVVIATRTSSSAGPRATPSEVSALSAGLTKLQTIRLGGVAGSLSIGQLSDVWVSLPDTGTVARVGADGTVTRFTLGGRPGQVAAGPQGVWVGGSSQGTLVRVDEQASQVMSKSSLSAAPSALAVNRDDGTAWAADSSGNVVHVGLDGSVSGQTAHVAPPVLGLGVGEGWVWAVNGLASGLVRISQDGSGSATAFNTHPGPVSVTFNQGVWTGHADGRVTRFDPRTDHLKVNTDVAVAPSLGQVQAIETQSSVWAISQRSQMLYRISTQTGAPVMGTVRFASSPVALGVAESSVWVATADGNLTQIGF